MILQYSVNVLKFESLIKQIILVWIGLDWSGLDPFELNLIMGLDWIEIHALLKYIIKMDQSWPFELKGRIDPGSLTTPRED